MAGDSENFGPQKRRKHPRKLVKTDVSYQYQSDRLNRTFAGSGMTVNISSSGAMVRIENYIPPQAEISLNIMTKDGRIIETLSRVIHCNRVSFNLYEVGVQFLKVKKKK